MHEKGIGKANKHTRKRPQGKGNPAVSYFYGFRRFPLNAGERGAAGGRFPGDAVCLGMEKGAAARGGGGGARSALKGSGRRPWRCAMWSGPGTISSTQKPPNSSLLLSSAKRAPRQTA